MPISEQLVADIERAFDYRGDVTVHGTDGSAVVGYLFNRTIRPTPQFPAGHVELFRTSDGVRVALGYDQIRAIELSGPDCAATTPHPSPADVEP